MLDGDDNETRSILKLDLIFQGANARRQTAAESSVRRRDIKSGRSS
jgi:hypothetical protein